MAAEQAVDAQLVGQALSLFGLTAYVSKSANKSLYVS
jgi:hypothetical protein